MVSNAFLFLTANIIKKQKKSKRKMLRKACEKEKLIILTF